MPVISPGSIVPVGQTLGLWSNGFFRACPEAKALIKTIEQVEVHSKNEFFRAIEQVGLKLKDSARTSLAENPEDLKDYMPWFGADNYIRESPSMILASPTAEGEQATPFFRLHALSPRHPLSEPIRCLYDITTAELR